MRGLTPTTTWTSVCVACHTHPLSMSEFLLLLPSTGINSKNQNWSQVKMSLASALSPHLPALSRVYSKQFLSFIPCPYMPPKAELRCSPLMKRGRALHASSTSHSFPPAAAANAAHHAAARAKRTAISKDQCWLLVSSALR